MVDMNLQYISGLPRVRAGLQDYRGCLRCVHFWFGSEDPATRKAGPEQGESSTYCPFDSGRDLGARQGVTIFKETFYYTLLIEIRNRRL